MGQASIKYSTNDVPSRLRVRYWNEWVAATITRSSIEPRDRNRFAGHVHLRDTGAVRFANILSQPCSLVHDRSHIAAQNEHSLVLHFQLQGESYNAQDGREAVIRAGDFTLCDCTRPYKLEFDGFNDMLSLRIPESSFRRRISSPELLTCVHMSGSTGMGEVASNFMRSCWNQIRSGLDPDQARSLAENVLDVLATSYSGVYRNNAARSSVMTTRRVLLLQYIEDNLSNPDLSPGRIAAALGYSPAYLHKVFSGDDESLGQYILRRRLEEASAALSNPLSRGGAIGDMAFNLGFKSATHFGRVFRERFGVTPSEYRQQHLKQPD